MLIYVTGNVGNVDYTASLVQALGVFPIRGFPTNKPPELHVAPEAELCRRVDAVLWLGPKFAPGKVPVQFQNVTVLYDLDEVRDWVMDQRRAVDDAARAGNEWAEKEWRKFIAENPPHTEAGGWMEA